MKTLPLLFRRTGLWLAVVFGLTFTASVIGQPVAGTSLSITGGGASALSGTLSVTGATTLSNSLNVTGAIDSDNNQFTFGTQGASYGAGFFYNNDSMPGGSFDTFKFLLNRSPAASWLWVTGTTPVNVMRLDGNHQLTLFQSDGTTAGVTLTPASNQISLGTATLTASGTALTTNGALTVGGTITGSSTGLTLSPGGSNQNILLLNGTGKVGIGTSGPGYKLDVRTPGVTATQVHVASTDTDAGGYLTSVADQNMYMTAGAACNGTAWIAKSTSFGIISSNTGYINFWTGTGTTVGATLTNTAYERMRITATGNVGIGTGATTPAGMLQVTGTVLLDSNATGLTSGFNGEFGNPAVAGSGGFRVDKNSVTNGDKVFSSYHANSGNEFYHQVLSPTSSQYIFNGGNVGIGTTSPGSPLTVASNAPNGLAVQGNSTNSIGLALSNTATGGHVWSIASSGGGIAAVGGLAFYDNTAAANRMVVDGSGNVGIGVTSPNASLDIWKPYNAGTDSLRFSFNDGSAYWMGIQPYVVGSGNVGYKFRTNNVATTIDAMAITGNGNVGIGTTAPTATLHVVGQSGVDVPATIQSQTHNAYISLNNVGGSNSISSSDNSLYVGGGGVAGPIAFRNGWAINMIQTAAGNVGIGTTSPGSKLTVAGQVSVTTGAILVNASGDLSMGSFTAGTAPQ